MGLAKINRFFTLVAKRPARTTSIEEILLVLDRTWIQKLE